MDKIRFKCIVAECLKSAGYHKKADNWYYDTPDCILVINLQKSQYSLLYYINLAVWIKALGDAKFPKDYECHFRMRATGLDVGEFERIEKVLNLEDVSLDDQQREVDLRYLIEGIAIPTLQKFGSLTELRTMFLSGFFEDKYLRVEAARLFSKDS